MRVPHGLPSPAPSRRRAAPCARFQGGFTTDGASTGDTSRRRVGRMRGWSLATAATGRSWWSAHLRRCPLQDGELTASRRHPSFRAPRPAAAGVRLNALRAPPEPVGRFRPRRPAFFPSHASILRRLIKQGLIHWAGSLLPSSGL